MLMFKKEGRGSVADLKTDGFNERIQAAYHQGLIAVPISFFIRTYPRALGDGVPDFIENGVRLMASYGDPFLFAHFPTTVYTLSG